MPSPSKSQRQCIETRGNVLVVASAGTGKTSSLVNRCLHLLLHERCSLEQILMVTFTEAAAGQMRNRIREALQKRLQNPDPPEQAGQIEKELALLDTAHICTLHSFCLQLVRQHFYQLGIAPSVLVLDEKQTAPLITQALQALFQRCYETEGPDSEAVRALISCYGRGSDEPIRALVLKLYNYARVLPDPDDWLARQLKIFEQEQPATWREWFGSGFEQWRHYWASELEKQAGAAPAIEAFRKALQAQEVVECLQRIVAADEDDHNWPWGTKKKVRGDLKEFLADATFLHSALVPATGETDPLQQDWAWVATHMRTLIALTREFGEAFSVAKRELGGVDFSDLEQFAIRLLQDPEIARPWRERFRYIFVDEFQDINRVQDAILTALSREGTEPNRFLVGDVKQSIYRFRLADPKIFCEYESTWQRHRRLGRRIPLSENFRSREPILDFVNALFSNVMRTSMGGIGYDPDVHLAFGDRENRAHLSRGGPPGQSTRPRVELHLIDESDEQKVAESGAEEDGVAQAGLLDLQAIEREARLVARRLRELREQRHLIWDADQKRFRPAEWRDMAVLLRSPAGRVEVFAKEFHLQGVPLAAGRSGFFEMLEISDVISILKLLDNPLQDVPLLAVLRSPLVALSSDELVEIRARHRERPFWRALLAINREVKTRAGTNETGKPHAVQGPAIQIRGKVHAFLLAFERWRELARQGSLSACLERILTDTHYEAMLLAEPRGEERAANVRRLLELVQQYDPWQRQGLYRFLRFVEQQQEAEVEFEPASAQTENAVRLMSIHRAKGLEFPIVVVACTGTLFNQRDLHGDVLLHETYGLCPRVKPPGAVDRYPSLACWLAKGQQKRELLGEELRLLYVGLTRACDTLILTGSGPQVNWKQTDPVPLSDRKLLSARRYLDWLLLWLPHFSRNEEWATDHEGQNSLFSWKVYKANDSFLFTNRGERELLREPQLRAEPVNEAALQNLEQCLNFRYAHQAATVESAIKRSSEVIWQGQEVETSGQGMLKFPFPQVNDRRPGSRPSSALDAAQIGDAHHRFLECVPLEHLSHLPELDDAAREMVQCGELTAEEARALDLEAILAFWNSEVGMKILSQASEVHRELPFTIRLLPEDLAKLGLCPNAHELAGERFIGRGKVDLAVLLPDETWVLDFKTDKVKGSQLTEKIEVYGRQLKLYALALERIYRRPVTNRWLHFLALGKTVAV